MDVLLFGCGGCGWQWYNYLMVTVHTIGDNDTPATGEWAAHRLIWFHLLMGGEMSCAVHRQLGDDNKKDTPSRTLVERQRAQISHFICVAVFLPYNIFSASFLIERIPSTESWSGPGLESYCEGENRFAHICEKNRKINRIFHISSFGCEYVSPFVYIFILPNQPHYW